MDLVIEQGAFASLLLEGLKWLIKKVAWLAFKMPDVDLSEGFYMVALAVINALVPLLMVFMGYEIADPILGMTWVEVLKYLGRVIVASLVSLSVYGVGIKPLKDYAFLRSKSA